MAQACHVCSKLSLFSINDSLFLSFITLAWLIEMSAHRLGVSFIHSEPLLRQRFRYHNGVIGGFVTKWENMSTRVFQPHLNSEYCSSTSHFSRRLQSLEDLRGKHCFNKVHPGNCSLQATVCFLGASADAPEQASQGSTAPCAVQSQNTGRLKGPTSSLLDSQRWTLWEMTWCNPLFFSCSFTFHPTFLSAADSQLRPVPYFPSKNLVIKHSGF